jgi:hypothetical protein
VGNIKALTFALPNKILSLSKEKMGGQKKTKKIFESLEVTAQNFLNSTR